MRVIIAGSRDFEDYDLLCRTCDKILSLQSDIQVVCGMARGADTLGEDYAKSKGYKVIPYPANWKAYGLGAGHIRNEEMAKNADALIAFWDGKSNGTRGMIELAKKYKLKVRVINI
jgi:hypothetical protein